MSIEPLIIYGLTVSLLIYAYIVLPKGVLRWTFMAAFLLMAVYKLYDVDSESLGLEWARHLPVYIGEAVLFMFLAQFSRRYIEISDLLTQHKRPKKRLYAAFMPLAIFGTSETTYELITHQGLPHILALPIFVVIISLTQYRVSAYETKYNRIIQLFTYGLSAFIAIHVVEFTVESQNWLPNLVHFMPHIEFGLFSLGVAIFAHALRSFTVVKRAH